MLHGIFIVIVLLSGSRLPVYYNIALVRSNYRLPLMLCTVHCGVIVPVCASAVYPPQIIGFPTTVQGVYTLSIVLQITYGPIRLAVNL